MEACLPLIIATSVTRHCLVPSKDEAHARRVGTSAKNRDISPSAHRKQCTLCQKPRDVLVRCRIDETGTWNFVCPGKCWTSVSGGEIDGPGYPHYQYGGMWKNKHAGVSAKKPKKNKSKNKNRKGVGSTNATAIQDWKSGVEYIHNDKVKWNGDVYICRRSHVSKGDEPAVAYRHWKESPDDEASDLELESPRENTTESLAATLPNGVERDNDH